jgi:hypothetical protein
MTFYIAPIVEGHTETVCLERLLQRVWRDLLGNSERLQILPAARGHRDSLVHSNGIQLARLAGQLAGALGVRSRKDASARTLLLILLDAEQDCPATLAPRLLGVARNAVPTDLAISCVLAKRMLENWIVAGASSLEGINGLPKPLPSRDRFEDCSGVKWLKDQLRKQSPNRSYRKATDAKEFIRHIDLSECRANAPSFDKLCRILEGTLPPSSTESPATT